MSANKKTYQGQTFSNFGDLNIDSQSSDIGDSFSQYNSDYLKQLALAQKINKPENLVTNQDAYVDPLNPIAGSYSGSYVGSVPLFSAGLARRMPIAMFQKIQSDLDREKRIATEKISNPLKFDIPQVDSRYERQFKEYVLDGLDFHVARAQQKYGKNWKEKLNSYDNDEGKEFARWKEDNRTRANEMNQAIGMASDALRTVEEGKMILPPQGQKTAEELINGLYNPVFTKDYNGQDLKEKLKTLKLHKAMSEDLLPVIKQMKYNINASVEEAVNRHNTNTPQDPIVFGSSKYYDIVRSVEQKYLSDETLSNVAKATQVSNKALYYDKLEDENNQSGAIYEVNDIKNYIKGFFPTQTKVKDQIASKREQNININNNPENPKNNSTAPVYIQSVAKKVAGGETHVINKDNYIVGGEAGITLYEDGIPSYIPFSDKKSILQAFAKAGAKEPNVSGIGSGYTSFDAVTNIEQSGKVKDFEATFPKTVVSKAPSETAPVNEKINWHAKNFGAVAVSDGIAINKMQKYTDGSLNIKGTQGGYSFDGIIIPSSILSSTTESQGWLERNKNKIVFSGNEMTVVKDARYKIEGSKVTIVDSEGNNILKTTKTDVAPFEMSYNSFNSMFSNYFNDAKKSIKTTSMEAQPAAQVKNTSGNKLYSVMIDGSKIETSASPSLIERAKKSGFTSTKQINGVLYLYNPSTKQHISNLPLN